MRVASPHSISVPPPSLEAVGATESSPWAAWWLRPLRWLLVAAIFFSFFLVSALSSVVLLPRILWLRPTAASRVRHRRRLNWGLGRFFEMLRRLRLLDYELPSPPELPSGGFLLVANHPSLLDVALLLGALPRAVSVVKASWYRSPLMGPLLRAGDYVPGPGLDDAADPTATPVVARIEAKLRAGVPVVVFPEGTRSPFRGLRRFHRGAIEAAVRAEVPVVAVFLDVDRPFLKKHQPIWRLPDGTARYRAEWLGVFRPESGESSRELTARLAAHFKRRLARVLEES